MVSMNAHYNTLGRAARRRRRCRGFNNAEQTDNGTYGSKSRDSWFIGRIHNEEYYWIAQKAALE